MLKISKDLKDYQIIDAGNGEKLEKWDNIILRRPDPQAIWKTEFDKIWKNTHAHYIKISKSVVKHTHFCFCIRPSSILLSSCGEGILVTSLFIVSLQFLMDSILFILVKYKLFVTVLENYWRT